MPRAGTNQSLRGRGRPDHVAAAPEPLENLFPCNATPFAASAGTGNRHRPFPTKKAVPADAGTAFRKPSDLRR